MSIIRTEAFDLAYRFVTETNLNIFLTGKAGTGKTTFLKYLKENSFKKMVVAAPTGVAAINAGGVTLHSLFQLPFAPFIPTTPKTPSLIKEGAGGGEVVNSHSLLSKIRYNREKLNLFRNLELLVIDEASMVASHTVDAIDTILRSIRRKHRQPFGGTQILFIGDLHQLQPVVKSEEWNLLRDYYSSVFFFDSLVLKENVPVMIELKEIFRQKDDAFIELLNEIRHNNLTQENFSLLNSRLKYNFFPEDNDGYITLTTHNRQADKINEIKLQRLKTPAHNFKANISGDFPEHLFPAEPELLLKEGAQVMFIKNDTETKKYFNGKIGVITALSDDLIKVKCKGEEEEISVKKHEWQNVNYSLHPDTREIIEDVQGSFEQYPLRLAWAITIHKSQGLTFDKVIIDAENAFANGQVYVALSRCTSLDGLILTSPINRNFLGAHQNLNDWIEKNQDEKNLPRKFDESRQKYVLQELQNIFTFKNWFYELNELKNILEEFKENLPSESLAWHKEISEKQKILENVSAKFNERIIQLCAQNPVEENQILQQRIKDAANYFSKEILQWKENFHRHPLSTDIRKISRQIDFSLNEINFIVNEILHKINHCKNGFLLNEYLKNGKKFAGTNEKVPSSYAQNQSKTITAKDTVHPELYVQIAQMRKHIADATNLPLFQIFSNAAIKNVCENLPANKESLLKVHGFGKVKVKQYGDEIIKLVQQYCEDNNLQPQEIFTSKREKKNQENSSSNTVEETIKLFKQGKNIEQIAAERNFVSGTIEGHLAQAIKRGEVQLEEIIPMEEVNKIAKFFPEKLEVISFSSIKEQLPDVSYGKLKMVLSWLQKEKSKVQEIRN